MNWMRVLAGGAVVALAGAGCSNQSQSSAPSDATDPAPASRSATPAGGSQGSGRNGGGGQEEPGNVNDVVPSRTQPTRPPVPSTQAARFGDGISVRLEGSEPTKIEAQGPGELSGAGYAFKLRIRNRSSHGISLRNVVVVATYGPDDAPAEGTPRPPTHAFTGRLPKNHGASGTYAYVIPVAERDVRLTVTYSTRAPAVVIDL